MTFITVNHNTAIGPRFMHISNEDLVSMAREFGTRLDSSANACVIGNDRRMTAIVKLPSLAFDAGDSTVVPQLFLHNDNTGRSSLRISVGLFRLVCSNGLTVGIPGLSFDYRVRHTWSENQRAKVLDLPMVAEQAMQFISTDLREAIDTAKDTPVHAPIEVVASLPIGLRAKEEAIARIAYGSVRKEDEPTNAWGLYNVVNEAIRARSRSEFTALRKDERLLNDILALAAA